ncbi:MAG: hypothetical protein IPH76_18830 [Xanthomonadales bacterium]|nr:hypothetical protein [Xanthomonadales bacterium]
MTSIKSGWRHQARFTSDHVDTEAATVFDGIMRLDLALNGSERHSAAFREAHRARFPVADAYALFDDLGAIMNRAPTTESPLARCAIALSALLATTQVR